MVFHVTIIDDETFRILLRENRGCSLNGRLLALHASGTGIDTTCISKIKLSIIKYIIENYFFSIFPYS